jgi:hypothetical protein
MKKLALVVALLVSIGIVGSLCAEPASAFFGGGGNPFGTFFGGAKAPCAPMYCAPYYCCPPVACKRGKAKAKKAADKPAKAAEPKK